MKFNTEYKTIFNEYCTPIENLDIRAGDVVVFKKNCFTDPYLKDLKNSSTGMRIQEMMKTKNNLVVTNIKSVPPASYGGYGSHSQNIVSNEKFLVATVIEQYSDGVWRNVVEVPLCCIKRINTGNNLLPISPEQKKEYKQNIKGEPVKMDKNGSDPTIQTHASWKDKGGKLPS